MTAIPDSAWLFTRGSDSVRLVREENSKGCVRLIVHGPGTDVATYEFADVSECMKRQAEIEQHLQAARYRLAPQPSPDHRREDREWPGPDHRRVAG